MRSFLSIALLLSLPLASTAQNKSAKDYPIKVHVSSSELYGSKAPDLQVLRVVIDGKKFQLIGVGSKPWALHVGDYPARVIKDRSIAGGQYERRYELMFPDGTTAQFDVGGESE
jgi:hypothetical protein